MQHLVEDARTCVSVLDDDVSSLCRSAELLRTRSIIHRRGDSFSSLRSDDDVGDLDDFEQRPLFFMHGVGLGLVSHSPLA